METGLELPNLIPTPLRTVTRASMPGINLSGFAVILSQHLSAVQIDLLIGFYRIRVFRPTNSDFKDAIASASAIAANSAELIYTTSLGCVQQDVRLISSYLSEAGLPVGHHNRFD